MDRDSQKTLTIGELARETGVSVRAIRHYDARGLLTSSRSCNGYRVFPAAAAGQVRQVQRLIASGFSIDDILSFPDCMRLVEGAMACPETGAAQRSRLKQIEDQIADLERRRASLLAMLEEGARTASAGGH